MAKNEAFNTWIFGEHQTYQIYPSYFNKLKVINLFKKYGDERLEEKKMLNEIVIKHDTPLPQCS